MGSKTRYESCLRKTVAGAGGVLAGTINQDTVGSCWISQNLNTIPEGEAVEWRRDLVVEITKTTPADVFAVGALVGMDESLQEAVLTGAGLKDYDCGKARAASANGDLTVLVELKVVHS